jgi:hypothetical protein
MKMNPKLIFPVAKADQTIISIDPGDSVSGITIIKRGVIAASGNLDNPKMMKFIKDHTAGIRSEEVVAIIEDIRPYAAKLTMQIIETCKYIGELRYRLNEANIASEWPPRSVIKKWVFDNFAAVCIPRIEAKILYQDGRNVKLGKKGLRTKDGELRKPSFHYVDDRIVIAAMKEHWNIETPKPGKTNKYKISAHGWQALAAGTHYLSV